MKKLILIIFITALSCSAEEPNDCECTQSFYEIVQFTTTNDVGLPILGFSHNFVYDQPVICTDEVQNVFVSDNQYYNIECE